jgi:hypothetical protein
MTYLKGLLLACLVVFLPLKGAVLTCLTLVTMDLILGIMAAHRRGETITSSGLKKSVVKLFVYEVAIAMAFLAETYLCGPLLPLSKIVCSFVGLVELKSGLENLSEISGGNLLTALLSKLNQK